MTQEEEIINPKYKKIREAVLTALQKASRESSAKQVKSDREKSETSESEEEKEEKKRTASPKPSEVKTDKVKPTKEVKEKQIPIVQGKLLGFANVRKFFSKFVTRKTQATGAASKTAGLDEQNGQGPHHHMWKVGLLSLIVVVVALLALLTAGIYVLNWEQPNVKKIASWLPYPAGLVNQEIVWLDDYWSDFDTLKHFYNYQVSLGNYKEIPTGQSLRDTVWERLSSLIVVSQIADEYGITVTEEEVNQEIDKIIKETGDIETVRNNLSEYYRWDIDTFSDKVVFPYLLEQKVVEAISKSEGIAQEAEQEAEEVLQKVKNDPGTFADLARQYSDDTATAEAGGDLGYFNRGVMVPEFEDTVFAMEPGEISGVVKTQFGYHIIKLEEKIVDEDNPENIQVKASHILIVPKSAQDIIAEKLNEANVRRFIY